MTRARRVGLAVAVAACLGVVRPAARDVSVVDWLDRYESGRFDEVVRELDGDHDFEDILKQLKRDGPVWISAKGDAARAKRELVAATFALEAARADERDEWKLVQMNAVMGGGTAGEYRPLATLYWRPPPLLIEWGCALFRKDATPRPIERWWQLAALAVAQRSEDPQFLIGDINVGLGVSSGEIANPQDEIKHLLDHARTRFPDERRFVLAMGIAADRFWEPEATQAYSAIIDDQDVGGEAAMRLGAMEVRHQRIEGAFRLFDRAEEITRDPYVVYLARLFRGEVYNRDGLTAEAEAAYRGAVAAWPDGQAAAMALAAIVFRDGRRAEAQHLAGRVLMVAPPTFDPWKEYVHADDRFWPRLIGKLRTEIQR